MQQSRSSVRQGVKPAEQKKAKYIDSIMQTHKAREMENEKVFERKMQKEAEAEAHLYGDKEKFMTSAYRAKIAARDEYEADLRRKDAEEAREDVTKRGGLGHFYANLLDGKLAPDTKLAAGSNTAPADPASAPPRPGDAGTADDADEAATAAPSAPPPSDSARGKPLVDESLASSISQAVSAIGSLPRAEQAPEPAAATVSHARRNDGEAVLSARERYLARKRLRDDETAS
jgi:coiled-coil domain-containing protein 55